MNTGGKRHVALIIGAGASRELGKDDNRLPLMRNWSDALVQALDQRLRGLSAAIGLDTDIDGEEFEVRLGRFLEFHTSGLPMSEVFKSLYLEPITTTGHSTFDEMFAQAKGRSATAMEVIYESLFAEFSSRVVDRGKALSAYSELVRILTASGTETHLTFATTNYDHAIEVAIRGIEGLEVEDGFEQEPDSTPILRPRKIARGALQKSSTVPVLHLHGAVGWYRREDGEVVKHFGDLDYNPSLGIPALLLPDPKKSVAGMDALQQDLWRQFEELLKDSTEIVILGHSLHDAHLMDLVREQGQARQAVCWYFSDSSEGTQADQDREWIRSELPDAEIFAATFGPRPKFEPAFSDWLTRT